jgi:Flp pilus assembly protein TadG
MRGVPPPPLLEEPSSRNMRATPRLRTRDTPARMSSTVDPERQQPLTRERIRQIEARGCRSCGTRRVAPHEPHHRNRLGPPGVGTMPHFGLPGWTDAERVVSWYVHHGRWCWGTQVESVRKRGKLAGAMCPSPCEAPATSAARERAPGRGERDDGAALVEFALIFPLLFALILGMVSAGIVWNQKLQLTHGAREGARYGAIVAPGQTFTNGENWGRNVLDVMIERAGSDLRADGAVACVSLVRASPGVVYSGSHVARATRTAGSWVYDNNSGEPCIANQAYPTTTTNVDIGLRVQATLSRPGTFEALFFNQDLTLTAEATAKSEANE